MLRKGFVHILKTILLSILIGIVVLVHGSVYGLVKSSPLGQLNSGILAQDVHCDKNFILVLKLHDTSPSCVKSDSTSRLLKQGWILASYNNTLSKGLLKGYVTFYPCRPVERPTDPPCTGNAHNYTVIVYAIDNKTIAGKTNSSMNGIYQIDLESGKYNVVTQTSAVFPHETRSNLVTIEENKTTVFNINMDSGIR